MDLAAASTPVDLSRLAAPDLVEQLTFDAIVGELVDAIRARWPDFDAVLDSDPVMLILQALAYREMLLRADFNDRARQMLLAFARRADGDVADASVISPAPGEVVVTVLSATGNGVAPPALLAKVRAIVDDKAVRPLTDAVTVQSATIVNFIIDARVWTFSGPDAGLVLDTGRAALAAYIADSRKLGRAIRRSGIEGALQVAGVERVELPGWVDIVPDSTKAAHCTAITVTHAGTA